MFIAKHKLFFLRVAVDNSPLDHILPYFKREKVEFLDDNVFVRKVYRLNCHGWDAFEYKIFPVRACDLIMKTVTNKLKELS